MSRGMTLIQQSLAQILQACLAELKRSQPGLDLDAYSLERGLDPSFHREVRRQLDPRWHTLGPAVKQLVTDLRILSNLANKYGSLRRTCHRQMNWAQPFQQHRNA